MGTRERLGIVGAQEGMGAQDGMGVQERLVGAQDCLGTREHLGFAGAEEGMQLLMSYMYNHHHLCMDCLMYNHHLCMDRLMTQEQLGTNLDRLMPRVADTFFNRIVSRDRESMTQECMGTQERLGFVGAQECMGTSELEIPDYQRTHADMKRNTCVINFIFDMAYLVNI
jgi:hypothetical protein